jgi:hypothetical protein
MTCEVHGVRFTLKQVDGGSYQWFRPDGTACPGWWDTAEAARRKAIYNAPAWVQQFLNEQEECLTESRG